MTELTIESVTALLDSDPNESGETVRDEWRIESRDESDTDEHFSSVEQLVYRAVEAKLLPEGTLFWVISDSVSVGAMVTVTVDGRRYASGYEDSRLGDDGVSGDEYAFTVLRDVASTIEHECRPPAETVYTYRVLTEVMTDCYDVLGNDDDLSLEAAIARRDETIANGALAYIERRPAVDWERI